MLLPSKQKENAIELGLMQPYAGTSAVSGVDLQVSGSDKGSDSSRPSAPKGEQPRTFFERRSLLHPLFPVKASSGFTCRGERLGDKGAGLMTWDVLAFSLGSSYYRGISK